MQRLYYNLKDKFEKVSPANHQTLLKFESHHETSLTDEIPTSTSILDIETEVMNFRVPVLYLASDESQKPSTKPQAQWSNFAY